MDKIQVAKQVIGIVVGYGTSKIVSGIIQSNVSPENLTQKVSVSTAAFVIGWVASDALTNAAHQKFDYVINAYRMAKAKNIN